MELKYRGNSYEYNPPAFELAEGETGGKYRGADWSHRYLKHIPVPQPVANLKYRGMAYCTGHPIDVEASLLRKQYVEAEPAIADVATTADKPKQSRQEVMDELNYIHLNNIRRNLERRLEAARAKGDQNLICLLEAEMEQIV